MRKFFYIIIVWALDCGNVWVTYDLPGQEYGLCRSLYRWLLSSISGYEWYRTEPDITAFYIRLKKVKPDTKLDIRFNLFAMIYQISNLKSFSVNIHFHAYAFVHPYPYPHPFPYSCSWNINMNKNMNPNPNITERQIFDWTTLIHHWVSSISE